MKNILYRLYLRFRCFVEACREKIARRLLSDMLDDIMMSRTDNINILTTEEISEAKRFWGRWHKITKLSHAFYKEKLGVFRAEFIPDGFYYSQIDKFYNDWNAAKILDNKRFYQRMFPDVKQPAVVCTRGGGYWFDENNFLISEERAAMSVKDAQCCFYKIATDSHGGSGVYCLSGENCEELFRELNRKSSSDVVVQKKIEQSSVIAKLNASSINTVRLISLLKKSGEVKVYSSVLRMGRSGSVVDNACSGGITCGILNNGQLKSVAYSASGERFEGCHPDSGVSFHDVVVPAYQDLISLVQKLHCHVPEFRLVSWDFAIGVDNEPILIEANLSDGELDFHQLNNGPMFGDDLPEIMDEVFGTKK